jgi:hypothetical protein
MSESVKNENDLTEASSSASGIETAFLQVPVAIKDETQQFIKKLMSDTDMESDPATSEDFMTSLPDQGCFLVISLEKIEEILNGLKSCLAMEPDNKARNIKSEIQKVMGLLG